MWVVTCPLYFCCREDTGERGGKPSTDAAMQPI